VDKTTLRPRKHSTAHAHLRVVQYIGLRVHANLVVRHVHACLRMDEPPSVLCGNEAGRSSVCGDVEAAGEIWMMSLSVFL